MTELIKLLTHYLKEGTAEQKTVAEEILLFVYKEKSKEIFLEEYPLRFQDMVFRNDVRRFAKYYSGCDPCKNEQAVFTGDDILNAPDGVYEVTENGKVFFMIIKTATGSSPDTGISPTAMVCYKTGFCYSSEWYGSRRLSCAFRNFGKLVLIRKA